MCWVLLRPRITPTGRARGIALNSSLGASFRPAKFSTAWTNIRILLQRTLYTGYFRDDLESLGEAITVADAAGTVGALVLRYPRSGAVGHVVLSDGRGGTVEAMGAAYGVRRGSLAGRRWDTGIKIPGIYYDDAAKLPVAKVAGPRANAIYYAGATRMKNAKILAIQKALLDREFHPGPLDGIFGSKTAAAVVSFQAAVGLIVDGEVGAKTAKALGIKLP